MSSTPEDPQGTPFAVPFNTGINLDQVNENIYPFGPQPAPSLTNTGILRDNGVTSVYETEAVSTDSQVFYAPNGKKVSLDFAAQQVSVNDSVVGPIGPYGLSDRGVVPFGASDWALTSAGTGLALTSGVTSGITSAYATTTSPAAGWKAVASSGAVLVAVAATASTTAGIARSTDGGVTWAFVTTTAPAGNWQDIAYVNGVFISIAATTSKTAGIARSTDLGLTWSFITISPTPAGTFKAIATVSYTVAHVPVDQATIVTATSGTNHVFTSTDLGVTFTAATYTGAPATIDDVTIFPPITSGGNILISGAGTLYALTTSTTWTALTPGITGPSRLDYLSNGLVVAMSSSASANGIAIAQAGGLPTSWTWSNPTTSVPGGAWVGASYGAGVIELVASTTSTTAGIAQSTDNGATWTFLTTSAPGGAWTCTAYSTNLVALANTTSITAAILYGSKAALLQSYIVQEYTLATGAILNTTTLTTAFSNSPNYACLVKGHQMTFATADVAYVYFTGTTVNCIVFVSGVGKTIFSGAGKPYNYTGISAFKNGGTYVVGGVPTAANMPQTYSLPSPYTTPALVGTECSYVANYEEFNTFSSLALNLIATPSQLSSANWTTFGTKIVISTGGVVTPTTITQAGLTIIPSNTYSGFGWASGRYKSTAGTKFSPFVLDGAGTPITITETVTDYYSRPVPACSFGLTANQKAYLYGIGNAAQTGNNAVPGQIVWGGTYGAMPISEYGAALNSQPVTQWLDGSGVYRVAVPTATGIQVSQIGQNTYQMFPVSRDVVQLTDSFGTIVNTSTGAVEINSGAHCPAIVSDIYLTGTNQLAYQTDATHSNAVDFGISGAVYVGLTVATAMTATSIVGAVRLPIVFYQSATGTLFATALFSGTSQIATDVTIAYVQNSNLPPPVDASYNGGGIKLVDVSALQTINESDADGFAQYYAGYTVANQYPVSYDFFNLFGQLYGFDGTKIFRLPINGATAGTPEQVAVATGLRFLVNSPTMAWFVSDFDNALYVFNGGASIEHWQPMTGVALVSAGYFNIRENSLYLQLVDSTLMVFRDGLGGQFDNPYTSETIFSTDLGMYFVDNSTPTNSKTWSYYAGSGTPITLTWQSGFYGLGMNRYCRFTQAVFVFKVPDPANTSITINYKYITEDKNGTETATLAGGAYTASSTGYVRFQFNPTQALTYGISLGVSCTKKITLYELTAYYTDGGIAPVTNRLP